VKIVHAADLHIDSPLRGLERYEGAPHERVRGATRESFQNIISLCISERARFLVLAGDIFDSAWKDYNTGLFFVRQLTRLREIGCDVLVLRGNHDFELTRTLRWPEHVHEFGNPRDKTHTFAFENDGVAFHGVSYASQKVLDSLLPHYPRPIDGGVVNIGVLHTNATGSSEHDAYAPCTVKELVAHGYDYWALGHVHGHAVLAERPWVVYPGNSQGRHARETGPKGCVVIDLQGGAIVSVRFHDTSVMRWSREELALEPDDSADDLVERVRTRLREVSERENALVAVRLIVTGGARAHAAVVREPQKLIAQLRSDALDSGLPLWLEKIELLTSPVTPIGDLRAAKGLVAELLKRIEQVRTDEGDAELHHVARALDPLRKKLGKDTADVDFDNPDVLRRFLAGAEALLAQRLTEGTPE
jgi:DNA repair exonuclease SbcCD nuclease subunit